MICMYIYIYIYTYVYAVHIIYIYIYMLYTRILSGAKTFPYFVVIVFSGLRLIVVLLLL